MDAVKARLTVEEYLEREETAEFRSEYRNGEVFPMPGGTPNHNRLGRNFCNDFNTYFEDSEFAPQPHEAFITDMKLWIPNYHLFTYPDVLIIEGEPALLEGRRDTLINPKVIVEVLSDSTELYDRTTKFQMYRALPSLREYILLSQYKIRVEQYALDQHGEWVFRDFEGSDAVLKLVSVPFETKLGQLYRKVVFETLDQ